MLEPAQHAVDVGARDAVLGGGDELVHAGSGRGLLGGGDDQQPLAHGQRVGIDNADRHRGEGLGRGDGRAVGAGDLGGDGQAEDGVGTLVGRLLEGGLEHAGGGGGRRGQIALAAAALPELGRGELAPVFELLVAEADGQRHHDDVVLLHELVGQVAGTVGDDVDAGHESLPRRSGAAQGGRLREPGQRFGGGPRRRWTKPACRDDATSGGAPRAGGADRATRSVGILGADRADGT